jgi:restriction system protein
VLVQCKQWRRRQIGTYTADASAFAAGKPIELVNGEALLAMIRGVQSTSRPAKQSTAPSPASTANTAVTPPSSATTWRETTALPCPVCAAPMVQRINRRTN